VVGGDDHFLFHNIMLTFSTCLHNGLQTLFIVEYLETMI
jgi:hypothetical protein